jgi:apolipoprotein N-acyltransferase
MLSLKSLSISAILFGLCIPLSLAPFDFWPLMFIGVGGFFWLSFRAQTQKQAMWLGWLFGVGYFGLGVSWIYGSMQTVDTPLWLSLVLTGGFCALMALFHLFQMWFFHRFLAQQSFALLLNAPLWWLINEWIREWFLTGMPWLYSGYAFIETPIAQLAAVVGIYGLSLVLAFISAWLLKSVLLFQKHKDIRSLRYAGFALMLFTITLVFGLLKPASSWTDPIKTITAAAVQSNVDQRLKWTSAQQRPTLEFYGDSISNMYEVDLIVWPEAAMTRRPEQIPSFISQVQNLGLQRDQAIITGMLTLHDNRFYNAMIGYGTASGEYQKQHLVPFGEYVPLEKYLRGLIAFFDLPMSTMYPAPEPQTPLTFTLNEEPFFAAPVICYEAAYPDLVRKLAKESDIITVVSNDAWFGDSLGPHQHLQITQMRAIENGKDIVRATQNGISALIKADGTIIDKSEQFVEAEVISQVTLRRGNTPFQAFPAGLIVWISLIVLAGSFGFQQRKNTVRTAKN